MHVYQWVRSAWIFMMYIMWVCVCVCVTTCVYMYIEYRINHRTPLIIGRHQIIGPRSVSGIYECYKYACSTQPRKTSTTLSSLYVYTYTESSICACAIVLAIYHVNWDNACANGATLCCVYLGIKNNLVCIVWCKLLVEHSFCCYLALHKFN